MNVSVIIPTYNDPAVVDAIASVLGQSHRQLELLVIDDGSTDGTGDAVAAIGDPRLRYIRQPNGGNASARNAGLRHATGAAIAWLDSDDLWPPEFLASLLATLEHSGADVAYTSWDNHYLDGRIVRDVRRDSFAAGQITASLFARTFVCWPATLSRRSALEGLWFDPHLPIACDVDFMLRLSLRASFAFSEGPNYIRRVRAGSISSNAAMAVCWKLRVMERFLQRLGGQAHVSPGAARRRLANTCLRAAGHSYRRGNRSATLALCRRAMGYRPLRPKAYSLYLRGLLLRGDRESWQFPPPLGDPPDGDPACAGSPRPQPVAAPDA